MTDSGSDFLRAEALYLAAAELPDVERPGFLTKACPDDVALRERVLQMLARDSVADFDRSPLLPDAPSTDPPDRIGDYAIEREIGRGGMGVVYLVRDPRLDRDVALKTLPDTLADSGERRERFLREAKLLAALNHPNIATIHSLEEADGVHFLTMEVIEGETLAARLTRGALPIDGALSTMRQVARALETAHARGVVHRDLKPANIMLLTEESRVKVLDFGLAHTVSSATLEPVLGSPGYVSPERLDGDSTDPRVDVFAFGCVLFECLTGAPAFQGGTPEARIEATRTTSTDLGTLPMDTPETIRNLLEECLAKDPDARTSSMSAVRRDIEKVIEARMVADLLAESGLAAREAPEDAPRNNLPRPLTSFVGRAEAMDEIRALVVKNRLVTLTGAGGCGKTRLACEAGRLVLPDFPYGVWFVALAPVVDPELVPQTIADSVGANTTRLPPLEAIRNHLVDRRALIFLDNCEHVLTACAEAAHTILQACANVHVLATTREPLGLDGETLHTVAPLAPPDTDTSRDTLMTSDAVRLFVDRARAATSTFALDDGNASAVADICRRLDGIPLALELAAASLRRMPIRHLASHLDDRFALLRSGNRAALPHHRTLRALVDWSYERLAESEKRVFERLAVFAGGWTLEGAEAVCADDDIDAWEVTDILFRLVEKSLVEPYADDRQGEHNARYRMLDTLRAYALERLKEGGEEAAVRARHRDHVVSILAEQLGRKTPDSTKRLDRLEAEHDNVRVALDHCIQTGDATSGLTLADGMRDFWTIRGHRQEAADRLDQLLGIDTAVPPKLDARALSQAGTLANQRGDFVLAHEFLEKSLGIYETLDDPLALATELGNLGYVSARRGKLDVAGDLYERAMRLFCEAGSRRGEVGILNKRGELARQRGDLAEAARLHENALSISRELEDPGQIASTLTNLGIVADRRRDYVVANDCAEESLALFRETRNKEGIAYALNNLALVRKKRGDLSGADAALRESLQILRELGNQPAAAAILDNLGSLAQGREAFDEAESLHAEGLALRRRLRDRAGMSTSLFNLAHVVRRRGDLKRARTLLTESLSLDHDLGDRWGLAYSLGAIGSLDGVEHRPQRAARLLAAAQALRNETKAVLSPSEQTDYDADVDAVRETLGSAFDTEWERGNSLSLEDAVALARGGSEAPDETG